MNLGIDFGSTYTMLSSYNAGTGLIEPMIVSDSPSIPSLVSVTRSRRGDEWRFGSSAKSRTGWAQTDIFKAFKMLLPEQDKEYLARRGYSGELNPQNLSRRFLEDCINNGLHFYNQDKVDNLVICAPEIWNARSGEADGRPILRDICRGFSKVGSVRVISEPAAASAYFAYNYELCMHRPYSGHILLVDYGGGTLDITLTRISACSLEGERKMEIKVLERTGAGEHEEGYLGKAGIAYMEGLMKEAICRAGLASSPEDVPNNGSFFHLVDSLEAELRNRVDDVSSFFDTNLGMVDAEDMDSEEFTSLPFNGSFLTISYGDLLRSYDRVIRPVLDEKLRFITDYMDAQGLNYSDPNSQDFKIALVGGFGNFYLVSRQIDELFGLTSMDERRENIKCTATTRSLAISYGAALIADRVVAIRNTAPYSVGLYSENVSDGSAAPCFALRRRQDIEFESPSFIREADGTERVFYLDENNMPSLIFDTGNLTGRVIKAELPEAPARRLTAALSDKTKLYNIGFSLDQAEKLSIHLKEYFLPEKKSGLCRSAELAGFNELISPGGVEYIECKGECEK